MAYPLNASLISSATVYLDGVRPGNTISVDVPDGSDIEAVAVNIRNVLSGARLIFIDITTTEQYVDKIIASIGPKEILVVAVSASTSRAFLRFLRGRDEKFASNTVVLIEKNQSRRAPMVRFTYSEN